MINLLFLAPTRALFKLVSPQAAQIGINFTSLIEMHLLKGSDLGHSMMES